ncbi:MAG TPA: ATP-binding protein [Solirubrobacteraceae bacterium]|nr:ATP-binding protein [Solirubrobacteraceae bacterium]
MSTISAQLHDRRPATADHIGPLRRALVDLAARGGASERQRQDIALAISEALTNVVTHAYGTPLPGPMALHAAIDGAVLEIDVLDEGIGMPPPATYPAGGVGLAIIARVTDGLELSDTAPGTRLRMMFEIS